MEIELDASECDVQGYAQSRAVNARNIPVGESPHIINAEAFEEVVETRADFHVGVAVHLSMCGTFGK